jgi:hypothetical protein
LQKPSFKSEKCLLRKKLECEEREIEERKIGLFRLQETASSDFIMVRIFMAVVFHWEEFIISNLVKLFFSTNARKVFL